VTRLPYTLPKVQVGNVYNEAVILADEDPRATLVESVVQDLSTDVIVKVGDVEMHLAGWQDPDHWSEDWAEKLGIDSDDAASAVDELLASATVERA
jgi:hypothetical protein